MIIRLKRKLYTNPPAQAPAAQAPAVKKTSGWGKFGKGLAITAAIPVAYGLYRGSKVVGATDSSFFNNNDGAMAFINGTGKGNTNNWQSSINSGNSY